MPNGTVIPIPTEDAVKTVTTSYGNLTVKRKGNSVSIDGNLTGLPNNTDVVNSLANIDVDERPLNNNRYISGYSESRPCNPICSMVVNTAGVCTLYKPTTTTGMNISGSYVI